MGNKICIIGNNVGGTSNMVDGLLLFERKILNQTINPDCFAVSVEDFNYVKYLVDPQIFINRMKSEINLTPDDKVLYLLDIELNYERDSELLNDGLDCLSMKLYDKLISQDEKCIMFMFPKLESLSSLWQFVFLTNYGRSVSCIIDRTNLYRNSFDINLGEHVLSFFS